jgi:hypothetical protein
VRDKKQILYCRFNQIDGSNIVIVIREIESWYLAGLPPDTARRMGVHTSDTTDNLTKEDFNRMIPAVYDSRIDFMFEILKFFSVEYAAKKNRSFDYFVHRYHIAVS